MMSLIFEGCISCAKTFGGFMRLPFFLIGAKNRTIQEDHCWMKFVFFVPSSLVN